MKRKIEFSSNTCQYKYMSAYCLVEIIARLLLFLSQKYVLFSYGTYMFHKNRNILFRITGKKVLKSWTFSPPLPRNRIDKYMFHFFLFPSSILRERWVEWPISSSFPLFVISYLSPIPHSGDLEKFQVALHIQQRYVQQYICFIWHAYYKCARIIIYALQLIIL